MVGCGRGALIGHRGSSQQGFSLGTRFAQDSSWEEMHSRGGETELGRGGNWETGGDAESERMGKVYNSGVETTSKECN
jgi:hypothetical protein